MSTPEAPVDNAVIEFYHRIIKCELIIPNKHRLKIKISIYDYLTRYYLSKRIHTKLKMALSKYEKTLLGAT